MRRHQRFRSYQQQWNRRRWIETERETERDRETEREIEREIEESVILKVRVCRISDGAILCQHIPKLIQYMYE